MEEEHLSALRTLFLPQVSVFHPQSGKVFCGEVGSVKTVIVLMAEGFSVDDEDFLAKAVPKRVLTQGIM